jgi:hypothetical protein
LISLLTINFAQITNLKQGRVKVEKPYKVVHGIKLVERTCTQCPLTFWVPKSHPQKTCGEFCEQKRKKGNNSYKQPKKDKRKLKYKVKESDYENR